MLISDEEKIALSQKEQETQQDSVAHKPTKDLLQLSKDRPWIYFKTPYLV